MIVGLDGKVLDVPPAKRTSLLVLKELVAEIEDGFISPERVFVIIQQPASGGKVCYPTRDNDLTAAECICLMEIVKWNLLDAMRR